MVTFVRGRPIRTAEPRIVVDRGLLPGRHRFQLEVIDAAGLSSRPDTAVVQIARGGIDPAPPEPLPPIRAVTPRRTPRTGSPR